MLCVIRQLPGANKSLQVDHLWPEFAAAAVRVGSADHNPFLKVPLVVQVGLCGSRAGHTWAAAAAAAAAATGN